MELVHLSDSIVVLCLTTEPQVCEDLKRLNEKVSQRCDFDVIVDFSRAEIITSSSISNLIILRNWLEGSGHRLILCNVRFATRCIFKTLGLDTFFEFAENRTTALAVLEQTPDPQNQSL